MVKCIDVKKPTTGIKSVWAINSVPRELLAAANAYGSLVNSVGVHSVTNNAQVLLAVLLVFRVYGVNRFSLVGFDTYISSIKGLSLR